MPAGLKRVLVGHRLDAACFQQAEQPRQLDGEYEILFRLGLQTMLARLPHSSGTRG